jgi:hypothetical protein
MIRSRVQAGSGRALRWLGCLAVVLVAFGVSSFGRPVMGAAAGQEPQQQVPGISPAALAQIDGLIAEKDTRSGVALKMDSQLLYELRMASGRPIAPGILYLETDVPYSPDGRAVVDVKAEVSPGLLARVESLGGEVLASNHQSLRAQIDVSALEALAAQPDVVFVQPRQDAMTTSWKPIRAALPWARAALAARLSAALDDRAQPNVVFTRTGQGSQTSEGDITHLAYAARAAFNADGTGVKIGVLSDGVTNLAVSQAAGDLGGP